jgi:hypothetical protein
MMHAFRGGDLGRVINLNVIGAEVRERTDHLPTNEFYLVDVSELLRAITDRWPNVGIRVRGTRP